MAIRAVSAIAGMVVLAVGYLVFHYASLLLPLLVGRGLAVAVMLLLPIGFGVLAVLSTYRLSRSKPTATFVAGYALAYSVFFAYSLVLSEWRYWFS